MWRSLSVRMSETIQRLLINLNSEGVGRMRNTNPLLLNIYHVIISYALLSLTMFWRPVTAVKPLNQV
jgi:hypothetical protein